MHDSLWYRVLCWLGWRTTTADTGYCRSCHNIVWTGQAPKLVEYILCNVCGQDNSRKVPIRWRIIFAYRHFRYRQLRGQNSDLLTWTGNLRRGPKALQPSPKPDLQPQCECSLCKVSASVLGEEARTRREIYADMG